MWPTPEVGDIVWCRFPQRAPDLPGPKPRPALVLEVSMQNEIVYSVKVAYGTSKKLDRMLAGEFAIRRLESTGAFAQAGLGVDTKFILTELAELPWNDEFFGIPPNPRYGQSPKLGSLHSCLMKAVKSAAQAIKRR